MAHIFADRVLETSTTTGTGALTLAGSVTGFRTFASVCSVADTVRYFIEAINSAGVPTGDWETGLGTYSGANTLTRTTVVASSNAGAAVNFAAGTKRVGLASIASGIGPASAVQNIAAGNIAATDVQAAINELDTEKVAKTGDTMTGTLNLSAGSLQIGGSDVIDSARLHRLRQYTVATLPAAGTAGRLAAVTDALAPTYLAAIVGGGTVNVPVYDDGTNWVAV